MLDTILILLVLLSTCFVAIYFWLKSTYSYWTEKNVPHPPFQYFFGNVSENVLMQKNLGQIMFEFYNKYTTLPYLGFYKLHQPALFVRDLDLMKQILISSFSHFHDNDSGVDQKLDPIFNSHLAVRIGEDWKNIRTDLLPFFTLAKVKTFYPVVQKTADTKVKYIEEQSLLPSCANGIEIQELCAMYTTENSINCFFGVEANCFKEPKSSFLVAAHKLADISLLKSLKRTIMFLCPQLTNRLQMSLVPTDVVQFFSKIISEVWHMRMEKGIKRTDFLDYLMELRGKSKQKWTFEDIVYQTVIMFFDAFETTSVALSSVIYELANNPVQQNILFREIMNLKKTKKEMTYDDIHGLEYLDACIKEALRLHPPAAYVQRLCTKDFLLPPCEKDGNPVVVEKGTAILLSYLGIQMDEKFYKNAALFDPERFMGERKKELTKYTYLPFGEGLRICPARQFGLLEIKVSVFNIVNQFEMRVSEKTTRPLRNNPNMFLDVVLGGMWLKFHKRKDVD